MLVLSRVSKRYGEITALRTSDLDVARGHTTCLVGPSGCGKTTLLQIAMGLIAPDGGTVRIDGELLDKHNARRLRQRMGYVIQEGGLFPHLTARENVSLMARYLGISGERIEARLVELAELTRFPASGLDRYPLELSGGQRQRVALMRALMLDPEVLLLDEPLGALDPMIRFDLQIELRELFRRLGKTVVLVSHDMYEAGFLGDAMVVLHDGRIVQRGTLAELLERPADAFVERFLRPERLRLEALAREQVS